MTVTTRYPELVGMIRRLYEELTAHDRDYHHRTDRRLVHDVREFLVAVGELPAPEPGASGGTVQVDGGNPSPGEEGGQQ